MNRELKFRIWDKTEKTFTNISPSFVCGSEEKVFEFCGSLYQRKNWVIQQFTGLYDKNKKPIYEGDRVRFSYTEKEDFFGEVVWLEDRASYGVRYENITETFEDLGFVQKYFEIVGNIFGMPCNPDHNGDCWVCDGWLSECPFLKNEDDKVIEIMGQKFNQHWAEQLLDVCKTTSVISEEQISLDLPEKYKPEFEEFMRGKTCPILDNGQRGVYSWDFERYLKTVLKNVYGNSY